MDAPKNLKHKPIVAVNDYQKIDGKYVNNTDAEAISLGTAQWDNKTLSVKVWRYSKTEKWSRQSEELPIHRAMDLSILSIASFLTNSENDFSVSTLGERISDKNKLKVIENYWETNKQKLLPRIKELNRLTKMLIEKE